MTVAFLAAMPVAKQRTEAKPTLPVFKPRFWYRYDRLDARPVAWSLRNRPDDWVYDNTGLTVIHKPSQHEFWVGSGWGFYRLYRADCSCNKTEGKFQPLQQGLFGRAFKAWRRQWLRRQRPIYDVEEFTGHFVR